MSPKTAATAAPAPELGADTTEADRAAEEAYQALIRAALDAYEAETRLIAAGNSAQTEPAP